MPLTFERIRASAAASILGVEVRTVQALASRGQIPGAAKIGGTWTFDEKALRKFAPKFHQRRSEPNNPRKKEREDTIYIINSAHYIKIGFTRNIDQRIHALRTSSPLDVELVASFPGTKDDEKELHAMFNHIRVRGEWFHAHRDIRRWLKSKRGVQFFGDGRI